MGRKNSKEEVVPEVIETPAEPVIETPAVIEDKPMNYTITLPNRVSATSIRVVGAFVIFNDGVKMVRLPVKRGVPVTITMRQ